jgi:hypothetical protein
MIASLCELPCGWKVALVYLVSLGVGGAFVWALYRGLRRYMHISKSLWRQEPPKECGKYRPVPPDLTGAIERFVFTTAVMVDPPAGLTATGAWLAIKMASNWHRDRPLGGDSPQEQRAKHLDDVRAGFLGLLCGLVSLFFAAVAGYGGRWRLGLDPAFGLQCPLCSW